MSQYLSQVPMQTQRQEMRLTPQLIQAMDILQLPLTALEERINEELEKNPVLENEQQEPAEGPEAAAKAEPSETRSSATEEALSFERWERLAREYDFDAGDRAYLPRPDLMARDAKMEAMANTAARPRSLNEVLLEQWSFVDVSSEVRRAGEALIGYIDEDGYIRTDLKEIAQSVFPPIPLELLDQALPAVQRRLDPVGIAARNLRECLLLQLEAQPRDTELEREIVRHHLVNIQKNRLPAIAKATRRDLEEVKQAVEVIRGLYPHPGHLLVSREVPPITPDLIVEYDEEGRLQVRLTRGNSPRLRVSSMYQKMMEEQDGDKSTRDFLRRNIESAKALIEAIHYRRDRLLEVARVVVERQGDFFEVGPAGLKVLRMSDLADEFGCDSSTISRTVAEKYIQTPRGILPLRYFFTGGTETAGGESASWDSVKARVREIVDGEDKSNPLNDDQIAEILRAEHIDLSRRTIAKYRQQLDIPPARERKQY